MSCLFDTLFFLSLKRSETKWTGRYTLIEELARVRRLFLKKTTVGTPGSMNWGSSRNGLEITSWMSLMSADERFFITIGDIENAISVCLRGIR